MSGVLQGMTGIDTKLTTPELLKMAADNHQGRISLSDGEKQTLVSLLRERGQEELDYGQELEVENVRLIKRVNGAIGIYYS